jgi:hypothetical protein
MDSRPLGSGPVPQRQSHCIAAIKTKSLLNLLMQHKILRYNILESDGSYLKIMYVFIKKGIIEVDTYYNFGTQYKEDILSQAQEL